MNDKQFVIDWFKGSRKYIQAADLVGTAWQQLGCVDTFEFASRKVAEHPVRWVEAGGVPKDEVLATFHAHCANGKEAELVAVQNASEEIIRMDAFAEEQMFAACKIEGNQLDCPILPDFTVWEHISSLHKYLLGKIFNHPSWWFVRLEGNIVFASDAHSISIQYIEKKRILYRSAILINGKHAGMVDYAMR